MKRTEAIQVGDLLKLMMDSDGNRDAFDRHKLEYLWSEIVGPVVNKATYRRYVDKDVLHVYISSAALKSELAFVAASLVDNLNNAVGRKLIKKIVFH